MMKTNLLLLGMAAGLALASPVGASVQVRGSARAEGDNIEVRVFADIASTPVISYSAKVFYDSELLAVVSAAKNGAVWRLSDGQTSAPYMDPELSERGEVLLVGAHWDASAPTTGVDGNGVLLGTIVFRRLGETTPAFDLSIGRGGDYASFVTVNGAVLESVPGQVAFQGVLPPGDDRDLDGLSDRWEEEYFGGLERAFYSHDSDGDGINDQGEEALGSDPTDPRSNLHLTLTHRKGSMLLEWTSFEGRSYTVESGVDCRKFEVVEPRVPATPPMNRLELKTTGEAGPAFYRVRLDAAEGDSRLE